MRGLETESADGPLVLLGPSDGSLVLPIRIAPAEALAIAYELADHPNPRPLPHDLVGSVLEATQASLDSVTVSEVRDGTFHATLALSVMGPRHVDVGSRPADAITLALRLHVPIYVSAEVLAAAGVRRPHAAGPETATALGITVQPLTPRLASRLGVPDAPGVLVAGVRALGTPSPARLQAGDVLLSLAGRRLASIEEFRAAAATRTSARALEIEYQRGSSRVRTRFVPP